MTANEKQLTIKDLAVKHLYYSNMGNFHSNDPLLQYETWEEFYEAFGTSDISMNLVFRWDIKERIEDEGYEDEDNQGGYFMEIFIIHQRKGIYNPISIDVVTDQDVPQIISYLQPHFMELMEIWNPLAQHFNTPNH